MMSSAEFKRLEITSEMECDSDGDYINSTLYISHDGGQDKEKIRVYNQIQELCGENLCDIFADYLDKHL